MFIFAIAFAVEGRMPNLWTFCQVNPSSFKSRICYSHMPALKNDEKAASSPHGMAVAHSLCNESRDSIEAEEDLRDAKGETGGCHFRRSDCRGDGRSIAFNQQSNKNQCVSVVHPERSVRHQASAIPTGSSGERTVRSMNLCKCMLHCNHWSR